MQEIRAHLMNGEIVAIIRINQFTERPSSYASRILIPSGPPKRQLDDFIRLSLFLHSVDQDAKVLTHVSKLI
jgi:hypothetical protein